MGENSDIISDGSLNKSLVYGGGVGGGEGISLARRAKSTDLLCRSCVVRSRRSGVSKHCWQIFGLPMKSYLYKLLIVHGLPRDVQLSEVN